MVDDMVTIGERIKKRRNELGLSQTDIHNKCDITSGALSRIENGKNTPSAIAFYKLSQVLECDMNWLASGESANLQNSSFCKSEEELLNSFRKLSLDDQEEIMDIIALKLNRVKRDEREMVRSSNSDLEDCDKLA